VSQGVATASPHSRRRLSQWWLPLLVAIVLVTGTVVMVTGSGWVPTGDLALLQLRLLTMPEDPPELGVYSRLGWWHPGPAFWWVMWTGTTLLGGSSAALIITMAVLHAALLVLAWWLLRRVTPTAAVWLLAAGVAVLWSRGGDFVLSPWNPYVGVMGVLTLVAAAVALTARDRWGAVLLLPVGSLLVQSHVGYAPLTVMVTASAVVLAIVGGSSRTARPVSFPWGPFLLGVGVGLVMWWPALREQLRNDPGNLQAILTVVTGEETLSWTEAGHIAAAPFTWPPQWTPQLLGLLPSAESAPWLLVLPVIATVVALVRREGTHLRALLIAWVAVVAVWVSAAQIQPPPFEYLLPWTTTAAGVLLALSGWVLLDAVGWEAVTTGVLSVVVAVLAALVAYTWATSEPVLDERGKAAAFLAEAMIADAGSAPLAVTGDNQPVDAAARDSSAGVATGIALVAAQQGVDVAVDEQTAEFIDGALPATSPNRRGYEVRVLRATSRGTNSDAIAVYDPFTAEQWQQLMQIEVALQQPNVDPLTRFALADERNSITGGQQAYELRLIK
jgi:hypothetical protein